MLPVGGGKLPIKENRPMELLLYHWHCILPVLIMVAAMLLMRGKNEKNDKINQEVQFDDSEITDGK